MTGNQDSITLREYLDFRFTQIDAKLLALEDDVDCLERIRDEAVGKASRSQYIAGLSLLVAAAALVAHLLQLT